MAELDAVSRGFARQVDGPGEAAELAAPPRLQCEALTDLLTTRAAKIDGDILPKMKHANDLVSAYNNTRGNYGDRVSAGETCNLRALAVSARPELDSIVGLLSEYELRLATMADAATTRLNKAQQDLQLGSDTWLRETNKKRKKIAKRHEDERERLLEQQRTDKAR